MKKLMMMAVMATAATAVFAQDDLVKQAQKLCDKGEFEEAVNVITPALTSDATTDKAAAWNTLSNIYYQKFSSIQQKKTENEIKQLAEPYDTVGMHNSIVAAMEAALKCDEYDQLPNAKGKVKPRFRKSNQARFQTGRLNLIQAGLDAYNKKEYDEAQKAWMMYVDCPELPLFTGVDLSTDEYRAEIAYYAGLASYFKKDYANAVKYCKIAAENPEKAADANEILLFSQKENCKTAEDSLDYVNTLKDLHKQNPSEEKYFNLLMDYYSKAGDKDAMSKWVDEEIAADPHNKMAWALKGEANMNASNWDEAVEAYKKAIEINPTFVQVYFNTGICLTSKAAAMNDELADKKTGMLTKDNKTKIDEVLLLAKDYLEKARELDPNREKTNWAYPLYQIYYALGDKEKQAELESLVNQ